MNHINTRICTRSEQDDERYHFFVVVVCTNTYNLRDKQIKWLNDENHEPQGKNSVKFNINNQWFQDQKFTATNS